MYIDDVFTEQVVITGTLEQNELATGNFATPFACAGGTCVVRVCADSMNLMSEASESNNCREAIWSSDVTAPVFVRQPTVGNRAFDRVTVVWQTNEPTNHTLTYGRDGGTGDATKFDPAYTTHHTVTLTMLEASAAYHVKVKATDAAGNAKTSAQKYFSTLAVADTPVQFGAVSIVEYDSGFYEFFTLRAATVQTANVTYVDFHLDGHDLGADYSPSPRYEVNLSPYARGYTRDTWYGQSHSVILHGYNLTGTATLDQEWDTTGRAFGHYTVMVELLDPEGNTLDEATRDLGLGRTAGTVGSLAVSDTVFDPGDDIGVSMVFSNTVTVPLTGTVRIQIQAGDSVTATATFTQTYANLPPGGTVHLNRVWDTFGGTGKAYRVLGNASYNGLMTDAVVMAVNARTRIYLPLVTRQ